MLENERLREWADSIDETAIQVFVQDKREEDLYLEFKQLTAPDHQPGRLVKEDRKNFAKAVSGFANSAGGVLVWGIIARKDDGVDAAQELRPIPRVDQVKGELLSHTGEAASPIVDGITHRAIALRNGSGFIVTYVPASDVGPHMAKLGENRYYKRSGDSFYPMEHFDIADMFGKRARPDLVIALRPLDSTGTDVMLGLKNVGRGIARFPSLAFNVRAPFEVSESGLGVDRNFGARRQVLSNQARYWGGADDVVHAGEVLEIVRIRGGALAELRGTYRICAEGMRTKEGDLLDCLPQVPCAKG
jgi:hypothetical protein